MIKKRSYKTVFIFLLLLFLAIAISYSSKAITSFYSYKKAIQKDINLTFPKYLFLLKDTLKRDIIKHTASKPLSKDETPLKTFYITAKKKDFQLLNSNLPQSGKENYIDAYLKTSDSNITYRIKLRYRGDSFLHWHYKQKSLRIKLKKPKLYNFQRAFNLINPPHDFSIIDSVVNEISKKEGLLTPQYEPVRVFINGEYMGVYIFLTQIDESFLRANHRMPGSIYYGDISPTNDTNLSKPATLFFDPTQWEKKASRNFEQKQNREDIELFTKAISSYNKEEFYNFVTTMLDEDKFFTFMALDILFGSFHHDYAHNHKIYFDPYKGKFEPIEWDLRYWSASSFKDNSLYPLQQRIKQDPRLEAKRDLIAYKLLKKYSSKYIIKRLNYYENLILRDLQSDIYRDTGKRPKEFPDGISTTFTINEFKKSIKNYENIIKEREKILYKIFNNTKLSYMIKDNYIIFKVDGNSPILLKNGEKNNTTLLYPSRKKQKLSKNYLPFLYGYNRLVPDANFYKFKLFDLNKSSFTNYITKKKITPKKEEFNITKSFAKIYPKQKQKTIILEGNITIDKTFVFNKNTKVIIKPGTTFYLSPKASIFFYGQVIAKGEKNKLIRFLPKDKEKPWGIVALQGKHTSNSIFSYCEFKDGSIATKNLIHYTAPFSIHDTKNITVSHCKIGKNYYGDDAMHIAYSSAIVKDSNFTNARSDALDIDISDVNVTNCYFKNSGNDALDIMTTKLFATNNTYLNSGDKGISIGEDSRATITNSYFESNYIGLEIKDNSIVYAKNLTFKNSKKYSIHLYNKNKRYPKGGTLKAKNLKFLSKKTIVSDKLSKVEINK